MATLACVYVIDSDQQPGQEKADAHQDRSPRYALRRLVVFLFTLGSHFVQDVALGIPEAHQRETRHTPRLLPARRSPRIDLARPRKDRATFDIARRGTDDVNTRPRHGWDDVESRLGVCCNTSGGIT